MLQIHTILPPERPKISLPGAFFAGCR